MISKLGLIAAAFGMTALGAGSADAAYTLTFAQVGNDVVATGTGTIDTAGFGAFIDRTVVDAFVAPGSATVLTGGRQAFDYYLVSLTGPAPEIGGGDTDVFDGTGDGAPVYFNGFGSIGVPVGYKSGALLNSSATFIGQTFASLRLRSGTYTWILGADTSHADRFDIVIPGTAPPPPVDDAVPEPATWATMILGMGVAGAALRRRRTTWIRHAV